MTATMSQSESSAVNPAGASQHLTLVIPIYNEQENLAELFRRVTAACDDVAGLSWSAILVDDGSKDDSVRLILEHREHDPRFKLLRLSRNFGHQPAITAGLEHVGRTDAVVILDADLQDPPELIGDMVQAWRQGADIVLAQRKSRRETGVRGLGFRIFHGIFGWLSDFPVTTNTGVFGLLSRPALTQLTRFTERNRFLPGLRSWIGFEQRIIYYDRDSRVAGEPKQTLRRLIRYAMDGVFSFSYKPLRLMTVTGIAISITGFIIACFFILKRMLGIDEAFTGFTTLVTLMLFLGGIQLIAIGLLGEYLGRIYDEVKNRPIYIIGQRYGFEQETPE